MVWSVMEMGFLLFFRGVGVREGWGSSIFIIWVKFLGDMGGFGSRGK